MKNIYLDHAATTPLDEEVRKEILFCLENIYGNPSSPHSFGRKARSVLEESREKIASTIKAHPAEIIFVGSGTEADNHAIKGIAYKLAEGGRKHIIANAAEHPAVLESCSYLEKAGFTVTYSKIDGDGRIDLEDLEKSVTPGTGLISVMHANNEVGTINPIAEISKIARRHDIHLHVDAVQSYGKIPVDVSELGADTLAISAHKIYGPKGIGLLYVRRETDIEQYIHGGGQERGRRSGTENVAFASGFGVAATGICGIVESESERLNILKRLFRNSLLERFPDLTFNGHPTESLPHIVNVTFKNNLVGLDGEAILMNLDIEGIAVSSGSACSSGSLKPSHVLLAMGRSLEETKRSVRFSMGKATYEDDLQYTVATLDKIFRRAKRQNHA